MDVKSFLHKYGFSILLPLVLSLAVISYGHFNLRRISYDVIPRWGILDEYSYVWQGVSIWHTGYPIGWSDSKIYQLAKTSGLGVGGIDGFSIKIKDQKSSIANSKAFPKPAIAIWQLDYGKGMRHIDLVSPFLDHPPFGGLILSLGIPKNAKTFSDIERVDIRRTSLYLGVLTSILLFIFTTQITRTAWVGFIAVLTYNLAPSYLFASRFALLENVLAPLALGQFILLLYAKSVKSKIKLFYLSCSGLLGGLAFLTKESGAGFLIAAIILMINWRFSKKEILFLFIFALLPIVLYIIWGLLIDPSVFLNIFLFNSSRQFWGALNFLSTLPALRFQDFPLDGWWFWGFLSIFIISLKEGRKFLVVLIPFIAHLFSILLLGSYNYPWYYLGLVPFLVVASSLVIWKIFKNPSLPVVSAFFLIPVSSSLYWGRSVSQHIPQVWDYRMLFILLFGFAGLVLFKKRTGISHFVWVLFCISLLMLLSKWNLDSIRYMMSHWGSLFIPN